MTISDFREHCCGCGECSVVCPAGAIQMIKSSQGFAYPTVNTEKCVNCSQCVETCSFQQPVLPPNSLQKAYAVKHKDENIRALSRSGGMFTAVSDWILEQGGVVYGCRLDHCTDAVHYRATTKEERDSFRGSKYIQSDITACYEAVRSDLQKGLLVLFSGTACQVNAIKHFCRDVDSSRLVLIDIACHGVPSQRAWCDYLEYVQKKNRKRAIAADFRDKTHFGWAAHTETFTFEDGSMYSCEFFKDLFYSHLILREDCFECPYKNLNRIGDITLADCWGIAENAPSFDDDKGVSLVLVNSKKGTELFGSICDTLNYILVDPKDYQQAPLKTNWEKPSKYKEFWDYYFSHSFIKSYKTYIPHPKKEPHWLRYYKICRHRIKKLYQIIKKSVF